MFLGAPGMALIGSFKNFTLMLKSLATLGINNAIIKLFIENKADKKELSVIYATFFWLFLFFSVLLGISVFIFSEAISVLLFTDEGYNLPIEILALLLPWIVLNTFWMAIYNGLEFFRKIIIIQIVSNIAIFGITLLFIWNGDIKGGLLSVAVSELAMVLVTYMFVRKNQDYFKFDLQRIISKKYISVIRNFSAMALLSAVVAPLTLIIIRNIIIDTHSVNQAGIWDGVNRLSGFYMVFFNSGLSLYYMPKLATLNSQTEFRTELKAYFKTLVPLFAVVLLIVFLLRKIIVDIAFTPDFFEIKDLLVWQMAGDFLKIMTLAFGFQIVVKAMMKEYFIIEFAFNLIYLVVAYYLVKTNSIEGVVQAYFYSNIASLTMVLVVFRKVVFGRFKQT